ncbi:MAG TPA: chromosome segregation protein SMC [Geobacteraceae bacterium]|nr:chromosome segregation protein SMC [Geobacteraceae bacterium]
MKIKRLDIIGFKSFVDKATLDFPPGITAIVGPNGCGKSNIVDAIRWVMGEQSAKNLRGRQMEDVIFGGSESRKPLGMAEVSLTFATDDGRVPARYLSYPEIQVTRRLFRDGESEYLINRTPCRLMDIAELFMDTGVGAKAYSIIEQGKIGMILLSKPEERRFLIEEAAGVTKFKTRKQVALKKIEVTRQNLLRIGDIIAEIRRQLNSLQRQAKKAEKYREYREELKEIELLFAARNFLAMGKEKEEVSAALDRINRQATDLSRGLEEGELRLEAKRIALLEREKELAAAQEEIFRLKGDGKAAESRLEFQKKELQNLDRQQARFREELIVLESRLTDAEAELKSIEENRGLFSVELASEEENQAKAEALLARMESGEGELARALEEKRHGLFSLLSEIAQFNNQYTAAAKRVEALAERLERDRREKSRLEEQLAEISKIADEQNKRLLILMVDKEETAEALSVLKAREEKVKIALAEKDGELQRKRDELSGSSSRLNSLRELEARYDGYGRGVRTLFLADGFRERFFGTVADAIETEEAFEAAVEAVLGERLQYVLSGASDDVMAAISFLKENAGGRCSFIAGEIAMSAATGPSGASSLLTKITISPEHRRLVEPLLSGVYLTDDLPAAFRLAGEYPDLTFVTPHGELVHSAGIIHGGSMEADQQGVIHKKREIRELSRLVADLTKSVRELGEERATLQGQAASIAQELLDLGKREHQLDLETARLGKDLIRSREDVQRLEERLALKRLETDQFYEEKELLEKEMADSVAGRNSGEERKALLEKEVSALAETLANKRHELGLARETVTAAKVRTASLKEKSESGVRAGKRAEELINDLRGQIAGHRAELEKGTGENVGLNAAIAQSEEILKSIVLKQIEAEAAFTRLKGHFEEEGKGVQEEEANIKSLRSSCDEARKQDAAESLKLSELAMKIEHLEQSLQERYRVNMAEIIPTYGAIVCDETAKRTKQEELERLINEMGEVNLMAIDEYRQLEDRYNFLCTQRDDLEESLKALQQAIQRINRTTRKRFSEAFQQVNEKFRELFPRLFCGGSAELRLTDENDLLETGIEIVVQPPGKKLQNVTLLSGGEKALTAVALIFAIFLYKPSPFCLLDEVDAPLDDANIGRFNEIVGEMSAASQFILITHNKTTMAVADTLFGVTMEEPGVSKLVSVKLN